MTNQWLKKQGLISIKELWVNIHYSRKAGPDKLCETPSALVRLEGTRLLCVVGAEGEKPSATRFCSLDS